MISGQRVGEYVLEDHIGSGTFGEVWKARHHVWADWIVAIKFPTRPEYVRQLEREGTAARNLAHPGIVSVLGFDPYADPPYLITDFIDGTSLRPWIDSRSLSVSEAIEMTRVVLDALEWAHDGGVIHGDVKPENILVHKQAREYGFWAYTKLTDFGLGRSIDLPESARESIALSSSLSGEDARRFAGTFDYMAPEQRDGREPDVRTDVYACGVVLYELLTGLKPAGMELPSDLNPEVPRSLDQVFLGAYCRREKRFTTARAFRASLESTEIDPHLPSEHAPTTAVKASP